MIILYFKVKMTFLKSYCDQKYFLFFPSGWMTRGEGTRSKAQMGNKSRTSQKQGM